MKKYCKYLSYVLRHKWFVFIECCKLGIPWRGLIHDMSKFLPSEWFAYAEYFYGEKLSDNYCDVPVVNERKRRFDFAWLLHQHRNPHHWEFWLLRKRNGAQVALSMPSVFKKELLADWRGAGRAISGKDNTVDFYKKNHAQIELHPGTRRWIEEQLGIFGFHESDEL
jgi:hypothetical protein